MLLSIKSYCGLLFAVKVLFLLFLCPIAIANSSQALAEKLVNESQEKMQVHLPEANALKIGAEASAAQILKGGSGGCSLACIKPDEPESIESVEIKAEDTSKILVFISLSMPSESLKRLFTEAEQQKAVLVLRGLKNNSFKETAQVLRELSVSASIDPNLFDKHQITVVPTFVYLKNDEAANPHGNVNLKNDETLTLRGNVSLSYALEKFKGVQ